MRATGAAQLGGQDAGLCLVPGDGEDRRRRATIAIGTWKRKIDCQETSSVSRPPTAGPSAAPVAPAAAQRATARRSEPTVAGSSSSAAVTAAAPPSACTQRASDQRPELRRDAAGEAGAGEDREPDGAPSGRGRRGGRGSAAGTAASAITRLKEISTQVTPATLVSSSR